MIPISLRTKAGELAYQAAKREGATVPLADEKSIKDFVYWRVIVNRFRADVAFQTSHMLIPRRVFPEWSDMSHHEFIELQEILAEFGNTYHQLTMNFPSTRSVPGHFHLHLNKFYDKREEMSL